MAEENKEYYTVEERLAFTPQLKNYVLTNYAAKAVIPINSKSLTKAGKRFYYNTDVPGRQLTDKVIESLYGDANGAFDQSKAKFFTTVDAAKEMEQNGKKKA